MTHVLLFCIAEEAKTFVHKALDVQKPEGLTTFYLVGSRNGPRDDQEFKVELANNESFETDFIDNIIAIADQRSASDDTLSIQYYNQDPGIDFGDDGICPPEHDKWYEFRVIYNEAPIVFISLLYVAQDVTYPLYFGRKDELTDERGIFSAARADELIMSNDIGA